MVEQYSKTGTVEQYSKTGTGEQYSKRRTVKQYNKTGTFPLGRKFLKGTTPHWDVQQHTKFSTSTIKLGKFSNGTINRRGSQPWDNKQERVLTWTIKQGKFSDGTIKQEKFSTGTIKQERFSTRTRKWEKFSTGTSKQDSLQTTVSHTFSLGNFSPVHHTPCTAAVPSESWSRAAWSR